MPRILLTVILIPIVAIGLHHVLFSGVDSPPSDFGSGQMFDMIAGRYDMINRVLAMRMDVKWRIDMVERVAQRVPENALLLDVATGTADVALLLSQRLPKAKILGKDPSNNMLDVGRQKVNKQNKKEKILLETGDAQDFSSLETSYFDGGTMAFGIRNVPDRQKALCEIHRVIKPNGVFCILEFSEPDESTGVMGFLAKLFIRHIVPTLGGILSGKPREYLHLQNSIKDFPSPKDFATLMEGLNCGENNGKFLVEEVKQMNFGSVQLYVTTPVQN